jgi:hypothetical protein
MKPILVENKFQTGARLTTPKKQVKAHQKRPYVGMGTLPYDWSKPLQTNYTQPIKNQFNAGMCGGEMFAQMIQIYRNQHLELLFEELSATSFYSQGYATGSGMTLQAVQDGASFKGLTTEANCPTPEGCTEVQARDLSWQTPKLIQDCLMRAGLQIVSVPRNIDLMAQTIRDYHFIGMMLGGTNNGTWLSNRPKPPVAGSYPQWAHYMASTPNIPVPVGDKLIPFYQSWGEDVGDKGVQNFGEDYINSGFIYDVFTFTKFIFTKDLKLGSFGTDVKYLQARLGMPMNTWGFGIFGPRTFSAVKAYQKAHGIPNTGYVGQLTRGSLNN